MGIRKKNEGKIGKPQASSLLNEVQEMGCSGGLRGTRSHFPKKVGMTVGGGAEEGEAGMWFWSWKLR
jgi:hypothetical protein